MQVAGGAETKFSSISSNCSFKYLISLLISPFFAVSPAVRIIIPPALRAEFFGYFQKPVSRFVVGYFSRNPDERERRQIHDVSPRERNVTREPYAFVARGIFNRLNHNFVADF